MNPFKFLKYAPGFSFANYLTSVERDENQGVSHFKIFSKVVGLLAYFALSTFYVISGVDTGEWNPIRQPQALHKMELTAQRKRDELYDKLFGPNGYADVNKDGVIDSAENFNLMIAVTGFDLTVSQLERAIRHYEAQMRER